MQDCQFKIIHNIYPTTYNLFKWKIKESSLCNVCGVVDDLRHSIFDCSIAKNTIDNFKKVINNNYQINLNNLNYEKILLGLSASEVTISETNQAIDTLLIIIKKRLILQGENKVIISEDQMANLIDYQISLEKATITNYKHFKSKWKCFLGGITSHTISHP